jgi:hypothetical protein
MRLSPTGPLVLESSWRHDQSRKYRSRPSVSQREEPETRFHLDCPRLWRRTGCFRLTNEIRAASRSRKMLTISRPFPDQGLSLVIVKQRQEQGIDGDDIRHGSVHCELARLYRLSRISRHQMFMVCDDVLYKGQGRSLGETSTFFGAIRSHSRGEDLKPGPSISLSIQSGLQPKSSSWELQITA